MAGSARGLQWLTIAPDALAAHRHITLPERGHIDDGLEGLAILQTRHRNRPNRQAHREIGGAIKGINNPAMALGWGIGAAFFTQQAVVWKDRRQACSDGGVTPAITVGDQAAIRLHRAGDLAEISALTLSDPVDKLMQGRPVGPMGIGRHQSSSSASRSPKARCTRCWKRVVSTRSNNKPANSNPTA